MGLLRDKVAFVTGAAGGIGAACARQFAKAGADVVLADTRRAGADVSDEIRESGGEALFVQCDIRDDEALHAAFAQGAETYGKIDIVVANAGINGTRAPIERFPPDAFDELVSTNLRGTFLTVRNAVPYLKRRGGSIILVASVNGTRTFHHAGTSVYCATKAGVTALAKSLASELGRYGIRVNTLCPGHTRTDIQSSTKLLDIESIDLAMSFPKGSPALRGGIADPIEVADACTFLASDLSRHVSGAELFVDGGQSLIA